MKIESILSIMLISLMLPTTVAQLGYVNDNTPPSVASFNFAPRVVDISSGSQNITFTVRFIDDLSGISDGEIDGNPIIPSQARFYSESGDNYLTVEFRSPSNDPKFNNSNLVSGNKLNGVYVNNMVVPKDAEIGNWTLDYLSVVDEAGNKRDYDKYQMFVMGFPIRFYVKYGYSYLRFPF
ncbi:MAG: hypothetical protein ACE14P_04065 [Methanotrichaceae archaeon]